MVEEHTVLGFFFLTYTEYCNLSFFHETLFNSVHALCSVLKPFRYQTHIEFTFPNMFRTLGHYLNV